MLLKRILVIIVLLPIGLAAIYLGGWYFVALTAVILLPASSEFVGLFKHAGYKPSLGIALVFTLLFVLSRAVYEFEYCHLLLSILILTSMAYHLITFERGREKAGTDFAITLSAAMYIGWLGAYLVSLRNIQNGMWWVILVLTSVWLADSGAYIVGKTIGKHNITPRLSPKKTWEGYIGGIVFGTIGAALLALVIQNINTDNSTITPLYGAIIGLIISAFSILGDLGESMIKRQVGQKDSGNLLPGHGGAFDRIDSWLWGVIIGYYLIVMFFL